MYAHTLAVPITGAATATHSRHFIPHVSSYIELHHCHAVFIHRESQQVRRSRYTRKTRKRQRHGPCRSLRTDWIAGVRLIGLLFYTVMVTAPSRWRRSSCQDLETGCLKLAVVKFLGVQIFNHNILIFQP